MTNNSFSLYKPSISFAENGIFSWKLLMTIFGLSMATNVINVFKIGNTYVSIAQFVTYVLFFLLLFKGVKIKPFLHSIKISFAFILFLVPFSFVFLYSSGYFALASTFFAGIIELLSVLLAGLVILNKRDYIPFLLKGIVIGLILNCLISIVSFMKWNITGSSINFGAIFHLDSYAFYDTSWRFRAQGLFTESSYFVCYLCVSLPIALLIKPIRISNYIVLALVLFSAALSLSGNILTLGVELILCFFVKITLIKNAFKKKHLLWLILLLIAFFLIFYLNKDTSFVLSLSDKISEGLRGSNIFDQSNSPRLINMINSLTLIRSNLFGFGYNMGAKVISLNFIDESSGAANTFLRIMLDLGLAGGIAYCAMFCQYSLASMFNIKYDSLRRTIGVSLFGLFACQVSNGYPFATVLTIVFLTLCTSQNRKYTKSGL